MPLETVDWLGILGPSTVPLMFEIGGCADQPRALIYRLMGFVPTSIVFALLPILRSGGLAQGARWIVAILAGCAAAGFNMIALSLCY